MVMVAMVAMVRPPAATDCSTPTAVRRRTDRQRGLTRPRHRETIDTMSEDESIRDGLRRAIRESGLALLRIAADTGVERASISRFVRGERSLRLDMADKLAAYFGLKLTRTEPDKT